MAKEKDPNDPNDSGDEGFGLDAPQGHLGKGKGKGKGKDRPSSKSNWQAPVPPPASDKDSDKRKPLAWKGFEEEEEFEPEVDFGTREKVEDEMDMTPMVDVVFLLLIFFMVTASFVTQQSIETPPPSPDVPSLEVIEDPEDEDDYVDVIIDQNNIYRITTREGDELEAFSDLEMKAIVRNAFNELNPKRLTITVHLEAFHEKVVTVWDHGTQLGFEDLQIKSTDEDY